MPQSLVQIYVHIIFSTKHRKPFLKDNEIREQLAIQIYTGFVTAGNVVANFDPTEAAKLTKKSWEYADAFVKQSKEEKERFQKKAQTHIG